ncbi:MAG: hypothetical protein NUV51_06590 [Sulfuricaulis sp.]|nr:hypothetical protein [Sulfuricaulis sp.]
MNLREASRLEYSAPASPPIEQLYLGALQRIADATELMAKRYDELLRDRDYWKRLAAENDAACQGQSKRNAALQGVITKMKKARTETA